MSWLLLLQFSFGLDCSNIKGFWFQWSWQSRVSVHNNSYSSGQWITGLATIYMLKTDKAIWICCTILLDSSVHLKQFITMKQIGHFLMFWFMIKWFYGLTLTNWATQNMDPDPISTSKEKYEWLLWIYWRAVEQVVGLFGRFCHRKNLQVLSYFISVHDGDVW